MLLPVLTAPPSVSKGDDAESPRASMETEPPLSTNAEFSTAEPRFSPPASTERFCPAFNEKLSPSVNSAPQASSTLPFTVREVVLIFSEPARALILFSTAEAPSKV